MRLVLIGDGNSPHLLKWARALAPRVELWAVSSRGFDAGFDAVLPASRRLALNTNPRFAGGNLRLLWHAPTLWRWLRGVRPDWLHAHYLTSHGTLAWLMRGAGIQARIAGSAWGSDILVTPRESRPLRWLTQRVLRACTLTTSDSHDMAARMVELGAAEVMVFPFGLEVMPPLPGTKNDAKDDALFFANRGLEPIYAPERVIDVFAAIAAGWPQARLIVANSGSLLPALQAQVSRLGLDARVRFSGRLDAAAQAAMYTQARWYLSLPRSDSVSVSLIEAMAHGCIPIVSDLAANRELIQSQRNGIVLAAGVCPAAGQLQTLLQTQLQTLLPLADSIAAQNRDWVAGHAMFPAVVERFVQRLAQLSASAPTPGPEPLRR